MHRKTHRERGAAVAELAFVVPLMLVLLLVVFDLGQGFLAFVSVTNGARDGARVALQDDVDCASSDVQDAAQGGAGPYVVTVSATETGGKCSVRVSYTYTPILPFVSSSFTLPFAGTIGPLWDGTMSETMVSG